MSASRSATTVICLVVLRFLDLARDDQQQRSRKFTREGKNFQPHCVAYEAFTGDYVFPWSQVNHHCDVPLCCNADHLYKGTKADNMADYTRRTPDFGDRCKRRAAKSTVKLRKLTDTEHGAPQRTRRRGGDRAAQGDRPGTPGNATTEGAGLVREADFRR